LNGIEGKPKMQTNEKQTKPNLDLMTAQCGWCDEVQVDITVGQLRIREPNLADVGKREESS
jgi:hypothetical protein